MILSAQGLGESRDVRRSAGSSGGSRNGRPIGRSAGGFRWERNIEATASTTARVATRAVLPYAREVHRADQRRPLVAVDAVEISTRAESGDASRSAATTAARGPLAPPRTARQESAHRKAPEGTGGRTAGRCAPAPNKSGVVTLRPGPSLAGLAAVEPGSWDRPEDRSPVRPGGSHLPLRARRNVLAGAARPQRPYPRTSSEPWSAYPRTSTGCGRHVDGLLCNARATSVDHRGGVDFRGR